MKQPSEESVTRVVEEEIDRQIGLDCAFVVVKHDFACVEVWLRRDNRPSEDKPKVDPDRAARAKSEMYQEMVEVSEDLVHLLGQTFDAVYTVTAVGRGGCVLWIEKGQSYERDVLAAIYKEMEEIKRQLEFYSDRDESEWGGNPAAQLREFKNELTSFVGGLTNE